MITQMDYRCWTLDDPDGTGEEWEPHNLDEAGAQEDLASRREENPETKAVVRQLDEPCWTVRCDGECEYALDEEEEGIFHFDSRAEAEQAMTPYHWAFGDDGRVFCEADAPEGSVSAYPSLAELEAAGQLRLPGVA